MDNSAIGDNPLFHLVRDGHRDIFSFSSKPKLYEGFDVSFPSEQHEGVDTAYQEAVAVYVVVDRQTMEVLYGVHEYFVLTIPYMPTYLAFCEIAPLEVLVR
jgi:deoxyinosine 3'endonuclease (endonuclease V)